MMDVITYPYLAHIVQDYLAGTGAISWLCNETIKKISVDDLNFAKCIEKKVNNDF